MAAQVHGFQTEVSKLLRLLAKSLYSNSDVFLRELVSNASDAVDKLRFLSITQPELVKDDPLFAVRIKADKDARTLTISDNGIGMTETEANEHLGTIAKSGTEAFIAGLSGDEARDSQLIGQFGVGFYSSFIVADKVSVFSRSAKASPDEGVLWESSGEGTFTSEVVRKEGRGTDVVLHLKPEAEQYLELWELQRIIEEYSDHIAVPVYLYKEVESEKKGEDGSVESPAKYDWVQVNDAKALWTMNPREVKDEEYKAFYLHLSGDYDEPLAWAHNKVEGELEYTSLLYCPKNAPWDLYQSNREHGLKLYVQRVFIMDKAEAFLPNYLRFIAGLVDSSDLPLNVSRELLQDSSAARKLKKALTKRSLGMIEKLAQDKEKYARFWASFGRCMKEGVMEDPANRDSIVKLLRFTSTKDEESLKPAGSVSLSEYIERAPKEQKHIYYLVAGSYEAACASPYLEKLRKKGIEVLLLWERIDEWLMAGMTEFEGREFISATASDLKLGELGKEDEEEAKKTEEASAAAIDRFAAALGDKTLGVKVSSRLVDSPSCVIGSTDQMITAQMRKMLEAAGQKVPEEKYTLEINPNHPLVKKALEEKDEAAFADWAEVIYEEALLADQGSLKDPAGFIRRMNALLARS